MQRKAVENKSITDADEIESKLKRLNEVAQKIGEAVNKPQGGSGGSGSQGGSSGSDGSQGPKKDGDKVDADFEEVPPKK